MRNVQAERTKYISWAKYILYRLLSCCVRPSYLLQNVVVVVGNIVELFTYNNVVTILLAIITRFFKVPKYPYVICNFCNFSIMNSANLAIIHERDYMHNC